MSGWGVADEDCTCDAYVIAEGDAASHDGPGWYWWDAEYPDEGSTGAFATRDEAEADARPAYVDACELHGVGRG